MDQQYNIANPIMVLDESIEDRIAIKTPENTFTYGQLRHLTTCIALHLQERGVDRSSCVAISTTDVRVAIASTLAIALLGGSWVLANRWSLTNEALGITHLLHGGIEELPGDLNAIEIDESWTKFPESIDPSQPIEFDGYASPHDTWMVAQSSGSTGHVKFMSRAYRCASIDINRDRPYDIGGTPWVAASLFHPLDSAVARLHLRVLNKGGMILSSADYRGWLSGGVNTVWASPANLKDFLHNVVPPPVEDRIPLARSGGAKTPRKMMAFLLQYFQAIQIGYGSAEMLRISARTIKNPEDHDGRLGQIDDHGDMQIVGADDQVLGGCVEGIVRAKSDTMVLGYIGDPEATAAAFRDGWFYPGDIGHLTEDGQIVITGRVTDILNLGGIKVNAVSIDEVIQAQAGVADGICFAKPDDLGVDELAAIVSLRDGADPNAVCDGIRADCRKELGGSYVPKYIYVSDSVPRNERGKATRHLAIEAVKGIEPASGRPSQ